MIKGLLVKPEFVLTGTVYRGIRTNCYYFSGGGGKKPTPDWKGRGAVVALATMEAAAGTLDSRAKRA